MGKKTILAFIGALLIGFFMAVAISNIIIPVSVLWGVGIIGLIAAALIILSKYKPRENDLTTRTTKYAVEWWKKKYNEELTEVNAVSLHRKFDGVSHMGFILYRRNGIRMGRACNIIVRAEKNRLDIVRRVEVVKDAFLLENPFYKFGGSMQGAPVDYPEPHMFNVGKHGGKGNSGNNVYLGQSNFDQQQNEKKK